MKYFSERNPLVVGVIGVAITAGVVLAALELRASCRSSTRSRSTRRTSPRLAGCYPTQPCRFRASSPGRSTASRWTGPRVLVTFEIDKSIRLGDRTEASIKTKSLLGAKILEVTPRGDGQQSGPIPIDRTTAPYQLPDALGDLSTTISGLDTQQVSDSLAVLADTFVRDATRL